MGALVGVTYAKRADWYVAVLGMVLGDFPGAVEDEDDNRSRILRAISTFVASARTLWATVTDWGPAARSREAGLAELRRLVGVGSLESSARLPVIVTATDLRSGRRVVLRSASAVDAVYASAALAGVLPPLEMGEYLLADGAYTDLAPVDVARELESAVVIAVDAGQLDQAGEIRNGYQAIIRAMEICHRQHARARFAAADMVLRPQFRRNIGTLEFSARRECVAAGIRIVRGERENLHARLRA